MFRSLERFATQWSLVLPRSTIRPKLNRVKSNEPRRRAGISLRRLQLHSTRRRHLLITPSNITKLYSTPPFDAMRSGAPRCPMPFDFGWFGTRLLSSFVYYPSDDVDLPLHLGRLRHILLIPLRTTSTYRLERLHPSPSSMYGRDFVGGANYTPSFLSPRARRRALLLGRIYAFLPQPSPSSSIRPSVLPPTHDLTSIPVFDRTPILPLTYTYIGRPIVLTPLDRAPTLPTLVTQPSSAVTLITPRRCQRHERVDLRPFLSASCTLVINLNATDPGGA
ncbi:hypothetical protein FA13DRAFT_306682 [Coprinellus micaceus]|uniref:Uncharacterized protein n=1 Tax=Coprinellus micaceus TaxID=71717 RepID=A0A4Y7SDH5_COPMI|nr:hypothetical protein FA13DRAFT_306682 [Coprinellus micaceus]